MLAAAEREIEAVLYWCRYPSTVHRIRDTQWCEHPQAARLGAATSCSPYLPFGLEEGLLHSFASKQPPDRGPACEEVPERHRQKAYFAEGGASHSRRETPASDQSHRILCRAATRPYASAYVSDWDFTMRYQRLLGAGKPSASCVADQERCLPA